jgi:hypothetical protein
MVLEAIQILVPLLTHFALVRLLLLHAHSTWIRRRGLWVDNGKGPIGIIVKPLVVVSMLEYILALNTKSREHENLLICGI